MVLVRRSSSIGTMECHLGFKVKYCHKIFEDPVIEAVCKDTFYVTAKKLGIEIQELGFDKEHCHIIADIGLLGAKDVAKYLKGRSAKALLKAFPELKKTKFWGSGLWSPVIYFHSLGRNKDDMKEYVRRQGMQKEQTKLTEFNTTSF